jgi:hypothetical protein
MTASLHRPSTSACLAVVAACISGVTLAQDSFVPLSEEPRHVPVLVNDAVRAVHVALPPHETTLYHEHTADIVTVTLEGADLINQNWQQRPTSVQRATGRVSNTAYGGGSHIHRVTNDGQSTFRIVAIEIFSPRPSTNASYERRTGLNELALDDDRVRIWRVALEPGQSMTLPALPLPTVRVTQTGGHVLETVAAGPTTEKATQLGDVAWLAAGTEITASNIGDSLVVFYDVEIK